ncbi:class I SAM-dependent methyltransferase [Candidatus Saccharibacteria bacterium]|nr:class I SAM-dependent methyltransferase [Candidatus Saccharibacteria bacterium]
MLRNLDLYDPIERTAVMESSEFTTYVDINKNHKGPTDDKIISEIRHSFYEAHVDVDIAFLDKLWEFVERMIANNQGLAQFTLDYKGAESDFFFPWLVAVATSPSEALEMAYGAGKDLKGNWIEKIEKTSDPIVSFVRNDPTFVYNRERQLFVADLVTIIQNRARSKVIDLGAGRLAWSRWHGFMFTPCAQTIYACDSDDTIEPEELFTSNLENLGIKYQKADLVSVLRNPPCTDADLVLLSGVPSYIPLETFSHQIVPAIYQILGSHGIFFFDYQINCLYLQRSMSIFNWPKMYLYDDAASCIAVVETIRKNLWNRGMKFSAEYAIDTYNERPSSVMITLEKL